MGRKPKAQARIEHDTKRVIDQYAEDRNVGNARAIRELLRRGAASEGYQIGAPERTPKVEIIALLSLIVAVLTSTMTAAVLMGVI